MCLPRDGVAWPLGITHEFTFFFLKEVMLVHLQLWKMFLAEP